jgi:4-hydroxy-4-methyl-2-oxoglutarate aldolase
MVRVLLLLAVGVGVALQAQNGGFSSSDLADATERLTGRRAHMGSEMRLLAGSAVKGPAITMRLVPDETASSTGEGLKAIQILENAEPGSVIVVAVEGDKNFAIFGATFATLAKSRRLGGFVVDGTMRGLAEFRDLAVPLFARGTVPGSAGGHYRLEAANVPIVCGGIEVSPGDLVVGDLDGLAVAPRGHLSNVLSKATQLRDEKRALLPLIARYRSYTQAVQVQQAKRKPGTP